MGGPWQGLGIPLKPWSQHAQRWRPNTRKTAGQGPVVVSAGW